MSILYLIGIKTVNTITNKNIAKINICSGIETFIKTQNVEKKSEI
jgi:hypothetical protein